MAVRSGLAALALGAVVAPSTTYAEGVGACAWAKAAGPEHEAFRAAYSPEHTGGDGTAIVSR